MTGISIIRNLSNNCHQDPVFSFGLSVTNPFFKAYMSVTLTVCNDLVSLCVGLEVLNLPPDIQEILQHLGTIQ